MDAGTRLTSPFYSAQDPSPGNGAFPPHCSLPTSGNLIQKRPYKHAPMLIFSMTLDSVELTVSINHRRCSVMHLAGKHRELNEIPGIRVQMPALGRQSQEDPWGSQVSY